MERNFLRSSSKVYGLRLVQFCSIYILMTFTFLSMFLHFVHSLCSIVHYSCALFLYFTMAIYIFSCCTFFTLHSFHVPLVSYAPFPSSTFLFSNLFMLDFFVLYSFYVVHNLMLHCYRLLCSRFASFSYCILCMLQFFPVALFPEV